MAQVSQITLDNVTFAQFRTDLNESLNALNSQHIGSSRPASAIAGTIWLDSSVANTIAMKLYDGTDDLELFSINTLLCLYPHPESVTSINKRGEGPSTHHSITIFM